MIFLNIFFRFLERINKTEMHLGTVHVQARIQDSEGGGVVHSEGGVRTGISGADPNCCRVLGKSTSKKKLQTAVGGGGGYDHPPKKPVSAHDVYWQVLISTARKLRPIQFFPTGYDRFQSLCIYIQRLFCGNVCSR